MVVVALVGITAALAVPSYAELFLDRRVQDDAAQISSLLREARARAMARGSAVLVAFTGGGSVGGTFATYESVTSMPGVVSATNRVPLGTCRSPSRWLPLDATNPNIWLVGVTAFTGHRDQAAGLQIAYPASDGTPSPTAFLCFTPTGRVFHSTTANFDAAMPLTTSDRIVLSRPGMVITRNVLVNSAGTFPVRSIGPDAGAH